MAEMDEEGTKKEELFFQLITLLQTGTLNFRWRAAEALGKEGDLRAVGPLIEALSDEYADVSWLAAKSLGQLGDPEAVPHLLELLKHEDKWNRLGALIGLAGIGDQRAVEPISDLLKNDTEQIVRKEAAKALSRIGGDAAGKALERMKEGEDEDEVVRKAVLDALKAMKEKKSKKIK